MNTYFDYLIGDILQPSSNTNILQTQLNTNIIQGQLYLNSMFNNIVMVFFNSQQILIQNHQQCKQLFCFAIKVQYLIKFQIILDQQNLIQSKKIGFKIVKEGSNESLLFYFVHQNQANLWIQSLKRYINQLGFHQRFKPIRKLGKGQFATVFQVESRQNSQKYAVKAFSKHALQQKASQKQLQSIINQIKLMRQYRHKNILKLQGVYQSSNSIYLVLQLLKGGSLIQRIQWLKKSKISLSIDNIKDIMMGIFHGLEKLNQVGIVHRDIKLENIVLRDLYGFQPVIIDFGLATFVDEKEYIYYRCGTAGFISPEVMNSSKATKIGTESDMFSAGAIFHYLLTHRPLFEGKTIEQVFKKNKLFKIDLQGQLYKNIDGDAIDLLAKMLDVDKNKRIKIQEAIHHQFFMCNSDKESPDATSICEDEREMNQKLNF